MLFIIGTPTARMGFLIFFGMAARGALQESKGSGRRAASRLFKLQTLKTQPQPPKDMERTLKIQRAACYSRVSGYLSARLAHATMEHPYRPARVSRGVEFYRAADLWSTTFVDIDRWSFCEKWSLGTV